MVSKAQESGHLRTPLLGGLLAYALACLFAPIATLTAIPGAGFWSVSSGLLTSWPLIAMICFGPFAVLRFGLSQVKPYRLWKHVLAGSLLGFAVAVVLMEAAEWLWIAKISLNGAVCGAIVFAVEACFRNWRLRWIKAKMAAYPGWQGTMTKELVNAQEPRK